MGYYAKSATIDGISRVLVGRGYWEKYREERTEFKDWWMTLDNHNTEAFCTNNRFISGLMQTGDKKPGINRIEEAFCKQSRTFIYDEEGAQESEPLNCEII